LTQSEKSFDKPLLIHININQTETVKFLLNKIETVANLTLSKAGITKIVLYSYKDARKNCITQVLDPRKSLEQLGITDKFNIICQEMLTQEALWLLQSKSLLPQTIIESVIEAMPESDSLSS